MKKFFLYIANRFWLILTMYAVSVIISSYLFSVLEDKSFFDGMWWSFVTALTIGYGDFSPASVEGRIVGVVFGHFWIFFIIPMIIANIITNLFEDKQKFTHEEQEWQENSLKKIAEGLNIKLDPSPRDY